MLSFSWRPYCLKSYFSCFFRFVNSVILHQNLFFVGIYEIWDPFLHWVLSSRMWVEILSLVACFLSLIDLWAFFLPHSPKSLSLHQFILICLLLKPGTRHVLFPGCRSLSAGFPHILPSRASPGWQQEAFHIESSVIEFPHTPLIFPPLLHSLRLLFPSLPSTFSEAFL